jgi:hypothetical protein
MDQHYDAAQHAAQHQQVPQHIPAPQPQMTQQEITKMMLAVCNNIQTFSGASRDGSPAEWLRHVTRICCTFMAAPNPELLFRAASIKLTGSASTWADNQRFLSWDDFKTKLQRRFGASTHTGRRRMMMGHSLRQQEA